MQQRVAINVKLEVGKLSEQIIVTGVAPLLNTETGELGQVVDSQRAENLPLNGRNFAQLALLTPGTSPSEPGARDENSFGFSSNGARSLQNNFLLDGVDNNSNLPDLLNETNYVIQPPVEALQEFKVQTNAYSAEFGRGNGAIINAAIKSGTNSWHGSAWEFLRNEKLDARNYFDDPTQPTPAFKQNQFGGTFGGAIVKNRTFFFVDYEGLRLRQAQTQSVLLPSPAEIGGDFTELLSGSAALDPNGNPALDCNGRPTFAGEIFDTRLTQNQRIFRDGHMRGAFRIRHQWKSNQRNSHEPRSGRRRIARSLGPQAGRTLSRPKCFQQSCHQLPGESGSLGKSQQLRCARRPEVH